MLVGRVGGSDNIGSGGSAGSSGGAYRSDTTVVVDRVKVIYSWVQIFTSVTLTFSSIPWPLQLQEMSLSLGVVNLDFGNLFAATSCSFATLAWDKFQMHMILPLLLYTTILLAMCLARLITKTPQGRHFIF